MRSLLDQKHEKKIEISNRRRCAEARSPNDSKTILQQFFAKEKRFTQKKLFRRKIRTKSFLHSQKLLFEDSYLMFSCNFRRPPMLLPCFTTCVRWRANRGERRNFVRQPSGLRTAPRQPSWWRGGLRRGLPTQGAAEKCDFPRTIRFIIKDISTRDCAY